MNDPAPSGDEDVTYVLQGDYGYGEGWEDLTAENTREAIIDQLRTYRREEGGTYRVVIQRDGEEGCEVVDDIK